MKLTIAELRLVVQLKQLTEQGAISEALELFFSMKEVWDKLKAKQQKLVDNIEQAASLAQIYTPKSK